jgi:lipid II:glycine glycyltransferase (peptidoglycan interpeptide bridge formation enzyme)
MNIKPISESALRAFLEKHNPPTFLQSPGWIDFNKAYSYKTWSLGMFQGKDLISAMFVFKIAAKRGTILFCPHGPIMTEASPEILKTWHAYLKNLAKKEYCVCIRISPLLPKTIENESFFTNLGYRSAPTHMHAELSTILDLTVDIETTKKGMRKTTRQMCKKGDTLIQNGDIQVVEYTSVPDSLYAVYASTASRGGFVPFTQKYLNQEYESFSKKEKCKILAIQKGDTIYSWGLWIISGKRAFYHQGANILDKHIPASYISHWQGIQWAKSQGAISYDFWGVGPKDDPKHPWANISLFKRGFGGTDSELVHAQDYPISWRYWITWTIETWRAKRRGF